MTRQRDRGKWHESPRLTISLGTEPLQAHAQRAYSSDQACGSEEWHDARRVDDFIAFMYALLSLEMLPLSVRTLEA